MAFQIRVIKPTAAFPIAGKAYTVEPSPRVRVLLRQRYIEKIENTPALQPYDPVIPDEPEVEVPVLADDHQIEDEDVVEEDEDEEVEDADDAEDDAEVEEGDDEEEDDDAEDEEDEEDEEEVEAPADEDPDVF